MDCEADEYEPGLPVRLNKCPYCTITFTDNDKPILHAHIQHHFDSLRISPTQCRLSRRCHDFRAETSDHLATHVMQNHIKTRQSNSASHRVQFAARRATLIRDNLIQRLAHNDHQVQRQDRPFARPDAPARNQIDNQQYLRFQPVDNLPRNRQRPQVFANHRR